MADLIAKVSRMDSNRKDTSYSSHLRSQDPHRTAGGHHKVLTKAYYSPEPAKETQDGESTPSSAVELDEIVHGSQRPHHGNFEINVTSEVQVQIEERSSVGGSTKEGSFVGNGVSLAEDDMKPLRAEDTERDARESVYRNQSERE
jgi:hypothetical protein